MSLSIYGADYGRYWPIDDQGYLINDTNIDFLNADTLEIADHLWQHLQVNFPGEIESFYLRGSAAWGGFVKGISDLDFFAITKSPDWTWSCPEELKPFLKDLSKKYGIVLECPFTTRQTDGAAWMSENPYLAVHMKCFSVLLQGKDWGMEIPAVHRKSKFLKPHLRWYLNDWKEFLESKQSNDDVQAHAKLSLRSAFELILDQTNVFSSSLGYCLYEFAKCQPALKEAGEAVLQLYLVPHGFVGEQKQLAMQFWKWLAVEIGKTEFGEMA